VTTTRDDGYEVLFSIVVLYGIDKGFKSVFLTLKKFDIPQIKNYIIENKKDGTPCAYKGIDATGKDIFSLSSFNKGSSNFYKSFCTEEGILMTWLAEEKNQTIFTREELETTCAIKEIKAQ
jgi:hypothetical protein